MNFISKTSMKLHLQMSVFIRSGTAFPSNKCISVCPSPLFFFTTAAAAKDPLAQAAGSLKHCCKTGSRFLVGCWTRAKRGLGQRLKHLLLRKAITLSIKTYIWYKSGRRRLVCWLYAVYALEEEVLSWNLERSTISRWISDSCFFNVLHFTKSRF